MLRHALPVVVVWLSVIPSGCQLARSNESHSACTASAAEPAKRDALPYQRALDTKKVVEKAIAFEKLLAEHAGVLPPEGAPWFQVTPGTSPVLILAPHATMPMREGELRFADGGTGALAVALHELADTTVLATTYASPSDPNFYDDNEFKQEVARLLATKQYDLVLDLHGSHPYRSYDVDFGTMGSTSVLGNEAIITGLRRHLENAGLRNFSQDFFPASKSETVTKWVSARGVPCVQLEINSCWLLPIAPKDPGAPLLDLQVHKFSALVEGLARFCQDWSDH